MLLRRLSVIASSGTAAVVALASPAFAYDCIRVSASPTGTSNSATHSGNWVYIDVANFLAQAAPGNTCLLPAYTATGAPLSFALGVGVAGGHSGHGGGVLAAKAPQKVLSDGRGIDHLDDTVLPAIVSAAVTCGLDPDQLLSE